jgi:hypothetical protein
LVCLYINLQEIPEIMSRLLTSKPDKIMLLHIYIIITAIYDLACLMLIVDNISAKDVQNLILKGDCHANQSQIRR